MIAMTTISMALFRWVAWGLLRTGSELDLMVPLDHGVDVVPFVVMGYEDDRLVRRRLAQHLGEVADGVTHRA